MKLSTVVPALPIEPQLDYDASVVLLGSCFTENIGAKLRYYGFKTTINPFGIIFNPHSLMVLLERSLTSKGFTEQDVTAHFSFLTHSDLNAGSKQEVLSNLNNAATTLHNSIAKATHLFITLGTAWVYELNASQEIVANCHKQPQQLFTKRLLSLNEIKDALDRINTLVCNLNPSLSITYTLSPVRHIKDGFVANQRSKARLHECIQVQVDVQHANYFPAYELVMDELRDYRFYGRDLLHLNELGIEFVWLRFRESVMHTNTTHPIKLIEKYRKLQAHRPLDREKHEKQLAILKAEILAVYPKITLNDY